LFLAFWGMLGNILVIIMGRILQRIRKTLLRVADLAANKGKTPDVYPWS